MQETEERRVIPELGRSPRDGNGNPLHCFCWKIPWTEEPGELHVAMGPQWVRQTDWQAVGEETARRLDRFLEGVCTTVKPLFFQLEGDPTDRDYHLHTFWHQFQPCEIKSRMSLEEAHALYKSSARESAYRQSPNAHRLRPHPQSAQRGRTTS